MTIALVLPVVLVIGSITALGDSFTGWPEEGTYSFAVNQQGELRLLGPELLGSKNTEPREKEVVIELPSREEVSGIESRIDTQQTQLGQFDSELGTLESRLSDAENENSEQAYRIEELEDIIGSLEEKVYDLESGSGGSDSGGAEDIILQDLILWLRMDEGAGSTAHDSSGYGNDSAIHGATWVQDGLQFDGSDDYVDCGNDAIFDITDEITLEAWVYLLSEAPASNWPGIIDKNSSYSLRLNQSSTDIYSRFRIDGATKFSPPYTASLNTWHHVVVTFDGSHLRLYINGSIHGSPTSCPGAIDVTANKVQIGRVGSSFEINAVIGEARIYNRAISQEEISQNYSATEGKYN